MRSAVTSASSGGLFFILKDLIHKTDKGDNEDTYLEQIRICNVHWHRPPFWRVKPLQCRKGRPPSVLRLSVIIVYHDIMSASEPESCLQISGERRMAITIAAPAAVSIEDANRDIIKTATCIYAKVK